MKKISPGGLAGLGGSLLLRKRLLRALQVVDLVDQLLLVSELVRGRRQLGLQLGHLPAYCHSAAQEQNKTEKEIEKRENEKWGPQEDK